MTAWEAGDTVTADALNAESGRWVATGRRTAVVNFSTTEKVIQTVTFPAINGQRYRAVAHQSVQSATAGDAVEMTLRFRNGATFVDSDIAGSTVITKTLPSCVVANKGDVSPIEDTFTATATGDVTVAVTMFRGFGTGTALSSHGAVNMVDIIHVYTA